MTTAKYKLVLRPDTNVPGTGLRTLNDIYPQPIVTASGDIDMSGNHIIVKRTEVGTQEFTTNGEKGIINVFSDSSNDNVSCINFKHGTINIGDNNRQYCLFQSDNTSGVIGSIGGNSKQVSFNSISDGRLKTIVDTNGAYNINNSLSHNNWLDSVNALEPVVYHYNSTSGNNKFTYHQTMADKKTDKSSIVDYQGFIAGQVQSVYPPAVHGISGETTIINGKMEDVYQHLDMTKLIPMMVGAIKELSTKVSILEALNAKIIPNVKYTSSSGLFSYTINNTNSIYDSNDYYKPIQDAIEKWDSLLGTPTIYTTHNNFNYIVLDININFSELGETILGGAYITRITSPDDTYKYGNTFATSGVFNLNTLYLTQMKTNTYNNGFSQLYYTSLHEIGHILGIGPLWASSNIINSIPKRSYIENDETKYYYTGEHALAEYKSYFPTSISDNYIGIPIEDDGGSGTQNVHIEEGMVDNGSISLATRTINDVIYYGLNDELMTGWSESSVKMPLSRVTLGLLKDIGYNVNYALADDYVATY